MKQLILIRHAKSSWSNFGQTDFERPLNDRGNRDAPEMAKRLATQNIIIDALVSSPANRALATAAEFANQLNMPQVGIIQVPELYHAPASTFTQIITQVLQDDWNTVAIFSHNPGITDFINSLQLVRLDNMPTCGMFGIKCTIDSWAEFELNTNQQWFFNYPKLV